MSFSVGERWASSSQFGRQMIAHPQNLLWAACVCEGVLWLYFTPLASIPLLLHTPHRLREALRGKKTWFGRAEGHALGMPGLAVSGEGTQCLGALLEHAQATEKGHGGDSYALVKDGLFFQCMLWTWYGNCHARSPWTVLCKKPNWA